MDGLYTKEGWIDIPALARKGCWLNVIIGSRQVGKTYGVLKYLLDNDLYHIYMRRTKEELEVISADPELNPYLAMQNEGYHTAILPAGKGWIVTDYTVEDNKPIPTRRRGICLPLSRIAKIRGFSGELYSEVLLDEFIPERLVVCRKSEGDAFRNALITINGNREINGKPPLRVWMLANANDLFSPIMISMNLVRYVEQMQRRNEELLVTDEGVAIFMPRSREIIKSRMQSKMLKHLNDGSEFAEMAFDNKFSYNDTSLVKPKPIAGWKPYFRTDTFYVWQKGEALYVTTSAHYKGKIYTSTENSVKAARIAYPELKIMYTLDLITFSDAGTLWKFKQFFDI